MSHKLIPPNSTAYITHEEAVALASRIIKIKNLNVIDFRIEPFSTEKLGNLGYHKLMTIHVQHVLHNRKSISSCKFFLKSIAPSNCHFNEYVFQEECEFFDKVLPMFCHFQMDPWAPQCYLIKSNVLVLENLKLQGFQLATKKFTVHQLKAAIAAIARFHGSSILLEHQLKKTLKDVFSSFFKEKVFTNEYMSVTRWLAAGIEVAESVACDLGLDSKYVSMAYEVGLQGNHLTDTEWNVLCHRDLWMNNLMFSKDEKCCRLLDFQTVAYASFAIDIVQLLYLNLDKTVRQEFEKFSIQIYHSVLKETLINNGVTSDKIISLEKVFETVEKKRIYGLISSVQFSPVTCLNKQITEDYTKDLMLNQYYIYVSRKDFVKKAMQLDDVYRYRVEESVKELVDYMQHFQDK